MQNALFIHAAEGQRVGLWLLSAGIVVIVTKQNPVDKLTTLQKERCSHPKRSTVSVQAPYLKVSSIRPAPFCPPRAEAHHA
ncbi:hypothetical protein CEXT_172831 [Caerostris extrusa]|uniref:Uncharacterized protein n=1 Tax=Caerostris extrusa TaxID=172846 RepID=A0AAV4VB86_CAEEX|nr:hypothetical protein CEXT_172831 [Caerostris extrusa]